MASRFWVGGSGTWDGTNTANWSATSGGAGGASVPGAADTVTIDTGSGTGITVTMAAGLNPTVTSFTVTANTLDLNNNNITATSATVSNLAGTARGVAFGATGQITLTGNNTVVWNSQVDTGLIMSGSRKVVFTYAGSVGTRTIRCSTLTGGSNAYVNMYIQSGSDTVSMVGGSGICTGDLYMNGWSGTMSWNQYFLYGNLTLSSTATYTGTPIGTLYVMGTASGGTQVINFGGKPTPCGTAYCGRDNASTTTYQFVDPNLTLSSGLILNAGTLDLSANNNNVTAAYISSNTSNTRRIIWGTGTFTLTGINNTTIDMANQTNMSWTGTAPTWTLSGAGTSGQTRTLNCGQASGAASKSPSILVQSGADILSVNGGYTNFSFGTFSGTFAGGTKTFYGNVTFLPGITHTSTASAITYAPPANVTTSLTTANVTVNCPTIINGSGTFVLNDNFIAANANTSTITLSGGTFNANSKTVNAWSFASTATTPRTLTANTINLFGSSTTIITIYTTGWTTSGTPAFNLTSSANTGTRVITSTLASASNNFDVNVLTGTDNVSVTGSVLDIDFTGYSGNLTQATNMSVFGNVVLSNTMAVLPSSYQIQCNGSGNNTITTNGCVIKMPIAFNSTGTYSLQDNLTIGNVSTSTYSIQYNGNLNLNNNTLAAPSWQIAGGKGINFGTSGQMILTGTNGTLWSAPSISGFSLVGNVNVSANTAAAGTRAFNNGGSLGGGINNALTVNITSGSNDTLSFIGHYANIDLTGWAGTWNNQPTIMYGNLTFPVGTTAVAGNNVLTLNGVNNVYTFDTSDVAINFPITVNASNTTVNWANDVIATSTSPALTITSGDLVANVNVTVGNIVLSGSSNRSITLGDNTWTLKGTGSVWNQTANSTVCNIISGNSTVVFSNDTAPRTINIADGTVLNNVVVGGNTSSSQTTFNGNITLNDISSNKTGNGTVTFSPDTTTTMSSFNITGYANNNITINSGSATTHNLVLTGNGIVNNVDYLEIYNSNASPATNTWYPGANSVNGGGTIGWIWPSVNTDTSNFFLMF